jgi:hypothetical protein
VRRLHMSGQRIYGAHMHALKHPVLTYCESRRRITGALVGLRGPFGGVGRCPVADVSAVAAWSLLVVKTDSRDAVGIDGGRLEYGRTTKPFL